MMQAKGLEETGGFGIGKGVSWSGRWQLGLGLNRAWICEFLGSVSRICSSK